MLLQENELLFDYRYKKECRKKYIHSYREKAKELKEEEGYWFNSENQYQQHLNKLKLITINSYTKTEEDSLYPPQSLQHSLQPNIQQSLQPNIQPNIQHSLQPNIQPNIQHSLQQSLQPIIQQSLQPNIQPNIHDHLFLILR